MYVFNIDMGRVGLNVEDLIGLIDRTNWKIERQNYSGYHTTDDGKSLRSRPPISNKRSQ